MGYKGYIGSQKYCEEDKIYHGKIEGIGDLVNYEAATLTRLENAFKDAVDYYIDSLREGLD